MDLLLEIAIKLLPLYFYTLVGYWLGKYKKVDTLSINKVLVYLVLPIIIFNTGYTIDLNATELAFPIVILTLVSALTFASLPIFGLWWNDSRQNISAFSFASSNFGYLGLAVALAIFSEKTANVYSLIIPAMMIHQFTFGIYVIARGKYPLKQGLIEIIKLPLMYTLTLGLILNTLNINLGDSYTNLLGNIQGAFAILGMMVIGLSMNKVKFNKIDWGFISANLICKFIAWPIIAIFLIIIDEQFLQVFTLSHYHALLLLSILPIPANTVVFANEFDTVPNQSAILVTIGTLLAAIFIPLMVILLGINP